MIDVEHQINAVERRIGSRVLEAGEARTSTISQAYQATVDELWDACTDPERIPRWFLPITGDLRVGGRYQLEGNAGGTIEACDPPTSFSATWEYGDGTSWIEVRIRPEEGGRARLELEHIAQVDDELWDQFGPGAVGVGWDGAFLGLATHLSTGAAVDPGETMEWMVSEEGKRFLALSSGAWCDASIAFGTDPEQARAAADRTTAFYTGDAG